jgi:hypothetical protein
LLSFHTIKQRNNLSSIHLTFLLTKGTNKQNKTKQTEIMSDPATTAEVKKVMTFGEVLNKSVASALRGGAAGAAAMGANVAALMWLRTTVSTLNAAVCLFEHNMSNRRE